MIKAIMIIWLGSVQSQTLTIEKFKSFDECQTARLAIAQKYDGGSYERRLLRAQCIPYKSERAE